MLYNVPNILKKLNTSTAFTMQKPTPKNNKTAINFFICIPPQNNIYSASKLFITVFHPIISIFFYFYFSKSFEALESTVLRYNSFFIFFANSSLIPLISCNSSKLAFFIFSTLPNFLRSASFFFTPIPEISSSFDFVISLSLSFL